jgi:hypothetical protein
MRPWSGKGHCERCNGDLSKTTTAFESAPATDINKLNDEEGGKDRQDEEHDEDGEGNDSDREVEVDENVVDGDEMEIEAKSRPSSLSSAEASAKVINPFIRINI